MSTPAKVHQGAAKHRLRHLAGTTDFTIVYERGGFKLKALSDSNWVNNPDNGKSTSCYIMMLSRTPGNFKSGVQSLTACPRWRLSWLHLCNTTSDVAKNEKHGLLHSLHALYGTTTRPQTADTRNFEPVHARSCMCMRIALTGSHSPLNFGFLVVPS